VELEDGRLVRLLPGATTWPWSPNEDGAPPANAIVAQLSTSGPGTVVTDNSAAIEQALAQHNGSVPKIESTELTTAGCAVASNLRGLLSWLGLALAGLLVRRRRTQLHR
ncbi:MAG: MYXO-CTERM sorting domain-containing protein, partial [Polyangiales bacterium]